MTRRYVELVLRLDVDDEAEDDVINEIEGSSELDEAMDTLGGLGVVLEIELKRIELKEETD